jgi:hypothetical protein
LLVFHNIHPDLFYNNAEAITRTLLSVIKRIILENNSEKCII